MPNHNLFHEEEEKSSKRNTYQDEHACCGLEAWKWLRQQQRWGHPSQWPTLPLTSSATAWDGCSHDAVRRCSCGWYYGLCKLLQQDLQTVLLSNLLDFLSHSFPSLWPALGDTEHDAALRTDLTSRKKRPSAWFCLPRLWIFSKLLLFPEFTFPREEQLQEIVSVKSPGKKTVMRYRSNLQKRCESLLLQWALPKGN